MSQTSSASLPSWVRPGWRSRQGHDTEEPDCLGSAKNWTGSTFKNIFFLLSCHRTNPPSFDNLRNVKSKKEGQVLKCKIIVITFQIGLWKETRLHHHHRRWPQNQHQNHLLTFDNGVTFLLKKSTIASNSFDCSSVRPSLVMKIGIESLKDDYNGDHILDNGVYDVVENQVGDQFDPNVSKYWATPPRNSC